MNDLHLDEAGSSVSNLTLVIAHGSTPISRPILRPTFRGRITSFADLIQSNSMADPRSPNWLETAPAAAPTSEQKKRSYVAYVLCLDPSFRL